MNREQIEKAAREYAEGITYNQDRKRNCHTDFIAGAEWMEKEVPLVTRSIRKMERLREIGKIAERLWHGMDEEPRIKANGTEVDVIFKVEGHDGMFEGTVWIDIDQAGGETFHSRANGETRPNGLMDFLDFHGMLLTPSASDGVRANFTMENLRNCNKPNAEKSNLSEQIAHKIGGGTSQLNPLFVEEMMGFPSMWSVLPFLSQNGGREQSKDTETR